MSFRKAEKRKAKLRLAITGPAGSGKTYGALLIAQGLGGKIAMLDTENGSGDLYGDKFDYDICPITAPYDVRKYLQGIHDAEEASYDVLIIDSLSHAWNGEGGLLDMQSKITENSKSGNSYAAWRKVTPWQNKLVEFILTSKCHIIATIRSKTEYMQVENEQGKKEIKKVGLAPVQREGMDYEFTTVFDLSINHMVTVSKDRTSLFDGEVFQLTKDTGKALKEWLDNGVEILSVKEIYDRYLAVYGNDTEKVQQVMKQLTGKETCKDFTQEDIKMLISELKGGDANDGNVA